MWQVHSAANAIKVFLPSPVERQLRKVVRKVAPRPLHICEVKAYGEGFEHILLLRQAGLDIRGSDILEVGTGWAPVMPLLLRLAGARHIYLTDAYELLNLEGLKASVSFLRERISDLTIRFNLTESEIEQKLTITSENLNVALNDFGMSYHVPFDYNSANFKVDAIVSAGVLEHIPHAVLRDVINGARQILRPGGMISHEIDNSDHREHGDSRLCRVDFLRYSDRIWSYLCLHPQDYTNRLRHSDYVEMIKEAGFVIVYERAFVETEARHAIANIPLPPRFQGRDLDDLAAIHSWFIAQAV